MANFKIQCSALTFFGGDSGNASSNNKYAMLLNSIPYGASGHTVVSFNRTSKFVNNSADIGGAIYASNTTVLW